MNEITFAQYEEQGTRLGVCKREPIKLRKSFISF